MLDSTNISIRLKSLVATAVLFAVLWTSLLLYLAWWARGEAAEYERMEAVRGANRVTAILAQEHRTLRSTSRDWSHWDESYDFVEGVGPGYAAANLTAATLDSLELDFMMFYDAQGQPYAAVRRTEAGVVTQLDPDLGNALTASTTLAEARTRQQGCDGLLCTPDGLVVLAAEPISRSDLTGHAGLLVMGRYFDKKSAALLEAMATMPSVAYAAHAEDLPPEVRTIARHARPTPVHMSAVSTNKLITYTTAPDLDGNPCVILRTEQERPVSTGISELGGKLIGILALFSVGMVVSVAVLNDRLVFKRLTTLSGDLIDIGRQGDPAARVEATGRDEISQLAHSVNTMLADLEGSQTDLTYLASHDSLTRLYNRRRFEDEVATELSLGGSGALLWCDLDHFKELNDSLGHAAGDELLKQFADMLVNQVRGTSLVSRLGGDEFGVLMPDTNQASAIAAAHRLLNELGSTVFRIGLHEIRISVSIGVVMYPMHGSTLDDLLAKADLAMYHSKAQGRNNVSVYTSDDEWRTEMSERMALSEQIARAIRTGRMSLVAQPIVSVATGAVSSYELLLRVHDETGALLMPDAVIPTAERLGLIRDIDRWVVREGIALLTAEDAAGRDTNLSINLSGSAFSDPGILDYISEELALTGTNPMRLTIEITETSAITDMKFARSFIEGLQAFGCRFALDDFGSGASSLYYLKHLPVDCLKIDGSIIRDLDPEAPDVHFVRAIVEMCKSMHVTTVAEYVEDEFLYALVSELGVDHAQGWAVGMPEPLHEHIKKAAQNGDNPRRI